MNPEQTPSLSPSTSSNNPGRRKKIALWLLIGPSALFVGTLILYPVTNVLFPASSVIKATINIILYLAGVVTILTWLPGIIIGTILLATKKSGA